MRNSDIRGRDLFEKPVSATLGGKIPIGVVAQLGLRRPGGDMAPAGIQWEWGATSIWRTNSCMGTLAKDSAKDSAK